MAEEWTKEQEKHFILCLSISYVHAPYLIMIQLFLQKELEERLSQNWAPTSENWAALNALFVRLHITLPYRPSADTKEK